MPIQPKSRWSFVIAISLFVFGFACGHKNKQESPAQSLINEYISEIKFDSLGSVHPEITKQTIEPGIVKVNLRFQLTDSLKQDDWKVTVTPAFTPLFHWAPHLTPSD